MAWTKPFSQISKEDAAIAGGKGASLGEMTQAGIPVPPGFVLLASAFEHFLEETDLSIQIEAILDTVQVENMETVERASEQIQALILAKDMPKDIAEEIEKGFKKLGAEFVAVRSSATAEDGANAAWAGQLDTFLNTTESTLLENVRRCWASLFTPRAIFYRFEKGLHASKISVAVVIQKMIQSEVSGIAFSVHPVTEDKNQMIIEAGFGLGEAIVSGQITPDSYVIAKEPRAILDKNITYQNRALWRAREGGNEWHELSEEEGTKPTLSDAQALQLAEIVIRIENHYGFPCDIEWALEAGQFFITQSRPITTLSEFSENPVPDRLSYASINTEFYDFLWRVGFSYTATALFYNSGYNERDFVFAWKDDQWTCFVSKKERVRLGEDALGLYTSGFNVFQERIEREIPVYKRTIEEHFDAPLSEFSDEKLADGFEKFCTTMLAVLREYFFLEYHSTDGISRIIQENDTKYDVQKLDRELKQMGELKLRLRELWNHMIYPPDVLKTYIEEIGRRLALGENASRYSHLELLGMLRNKKMNAAARFGLIIWGKFSNHQEIGGSEAEKILDQLWTIDLSTQEFKGQIGNRGVYLGRVKKIQFSSKTNFAKEINAMNAGDVLVSSSTGPEMILACKKAGAIITDEGGIISHAVIISRELGIPSIVGTKVATSLLHDGDMVEVDAEKGIVTILK